MNLHCIWVYQCTVITTWKAVGRCISSLYAWGCGFLSGLVYLASTFSFISQAGRHLSWLWHLLVQPVPQAWVWRSDLSSSLPLSNLQQIVVTRVFRPFQHTNLRVLYCTVKRKIYIRQFRLTSVIQCVTSMGMPWEFKLLHKRLGCCTPFRTPLRSC